MQDTGDNKEEYNFLPDLKECGQLEDMDKKMSDYSTMQRREPKLIWGWAVRTIFASVLVSLPDSSPFQ